MANGIVVNSNNSFKVMKAVVGWSSDATGSCQYPLAKYKFVMYAFSPMESIRSSVLGNGYEDCLCDLVKLSAVNADCQLVISLFHNHH